MMRAAWSFILIDAFLILNRIWLQDFFVKCNLTEVKLHLTVVSPCAEVDLSVIHKAVERNYKNYVA